ncbi:BTB/POZ protein [Elsinoe ampelina]|uniref:BTB/POZ protein n=1 Tax=Elsinoe ampelina TaxID=302913 RepID=A0A6A6G499_9PEZI|nr:BTB/POZ protein [Elsinoe ampelina]
MREITKPMFAVVFTFFRPFFSPHPTTARKRHNRKQPSHSSSKVSMSIASKTPRQVDSQFFNSEIMSDITIVFGDKRIRAHKILLLSQSMYFKTLFCGEFKDSNASELKLEEDDVDAVYAMLEYMYTGGLAIPLEKLEEDSATLLINLIVVADKYQVAGLSDLVSNRLIQILEKNDSPDTVFAALVPLPPHLLEARADGLAQVLRGNIDSHMLLTSFHSMLDAHGVLSRKLLHEFLTAPKQPKFHFSNGKFECDTPVRPLPKCRQHCGSYGRVVETVVVVGVDN